MGIPVYFAQPKRAKRVRSHSLNSGDQAKEENGDNADSGNVRAAQRRSILFLRRERPQQQQLGEITSRNSIGQWWNERESPRDRDGEPLWMTRMRQISHETRQSARTTAVTEATIPDFETLTTRRLSRFELPTTLSQSQRQLQLQFPLSSDRVSFRDELLRLSLTQTNETSNANRTSEETIIGGSQSNGANDAIGTVNSSNTAVEDFARAAQRARAAARISAEQSQRLLREISRPSNTGSSTELRISDLARHVRTLTHASSLSRRIIDSNPSEALSASVNRVNSLLASIESSESLLSLSTPSETLDRAISWLRADRFARYERLTSAPFTYPPSSSMNTSPPPLISPFIDPSAPAATNPLYSSEDFLNLYESEDLFTAVTAADRTSAANLARNIVDASVSSPSRNLENTFENNLSARGYAAFGRLGNTLPSMAPDVQSSQAVSIPQPMFSSLSNEVPPAAALTESHLLADIEQATVTPTSIIIQPAASLWSSLTEAANLAISLSPPLPPSTINFLQPSPPLAAAIISGENSPSFGLRVPRDASPGFESIRLHQRSPRIVEAISRGLDDTVVSSSDSSEDLGIFPPVVVGFLSESTESVFSGGGIGEGGEH
ncbi:hypothetical protein HK100_012144 [Physocladia obscura]|uniref:Uncharacterized protein n=1 Tax=Physocladia obscura TaxID=109957 RepID=A0AAD5XDI6_9FUNG|nr:hypothetical protein HK100_012144 [Physocladia obscura]